MQLPIDDQITRDDQISKIRGSWGRDFMSASIRAVPVAALLAAATLVASADVTPPSQAGEIQLQLGREFLDEARYADALEAFQKALTLVPPDDQRVARAGVVQAALRIAEFALARREAETLL